MAKVATSAAGRRPVGFQTWAAVGILAALYFVSFVDRVVLALLIEPLKSDLHIDDMQLGMLFGPSFAIFYAILGLPLARLADRGSRVWLVVSGALFWGACTLASGFANSYLTLVLLRVGLAVGEAALTPAAYSLIGSLFPENRRTLAASIYSATGIAGAAGAYILGAAIIRALGPEHRAFGDVTFAPWQQVFVIVALPAIVLALLFWAVVREPPRDGAARPPSFVDAWRYLRAHTSMYLPLFLGAGILQAVNAVYAAWGPEFLRRDLGIAIHDAGTAYGLSGLLGATLGILIIPSFGRVAQQRGRPDGIGAIALLAGLLGGTAAVLAPLSGSFAIYLACNAIAAFGLFGSSTGLVVAMQTIAPLEHRGTFVATLILSITLLGQGLGPPAVPFASSLLGQSDTIGLAMSLVSLCALVPGLILLAVARRPLAAYLTARVS